MSYLKKISAPPAANHVPLLIEPPELARGFAESARGKRFDQRRLAIVQKARLRLRVPYEAWERAWTLAGVDVHPRTGLPRVRRWWPLWELIDAHGYRGPLQ